MACLLLQAHRFCKDTTEAPSLKNGSRDQLQQWLRDNHAVREEIMDCLARNENPPEDPNSRWTF